MSFLSLVPRDNMYLTWNVNPITLHVLADDGVDFTPDVNIVVNDLNKGKKHFLNASGDGDSFKVNVWVNDSDTMTYNKYFNPSYQPDGSYIDHFTYESDLKARDMLDWVIRNMKVVLITTDAFDVEDGEYIITGNPSRKQEHRKGSIWELEFTKYTGVSTIGYKAQTSGSDAAIKAYNKVKAKKAKEAAKKKAQAAAKQTNYYKLSKCNVSVLVYSKTKKNVACVKYLQNILKYHGEFTAKVDGWFDTATANAVKAFQKKYNKAKKKSKTTTKKVNGKTVSTLLPETGKVDAATRNAIVRTGKRYGL